MSPLTTADLIFSSQANHNFSKTLSELKRSTLSVSNRLRSIEEDASFATRVADVYKRPLIANERCGSWYVEPRWKEGSAYFKSTDGHTGVWKFSTRRLNLHLLEIIGKNDGCIIVDSTRRGKRMPDALSKTIPIWCSVLNRLLFPENFQSHELKIPPQVVGDSEHAQISALLPQFLKSLQALQIPRDAFRSHITKPLRPIWVTQDSNIAQHVEEFEDFHPIICCTVSRKVAGGESSEGGYIQGAADDTENWAHGLTPSVFWTNKERLLATSEHELTPLIADLVSSGVAVGLGSGQGVRCVKPTTCLYVAPLLLVAAEGTTENGKLLIIMHPKITEQATWRTSPCRLDVGLGPHKLGSRNLRSALPFVVEFIRSILDKSSLGISSGTQLSIVIACENSKDLSVGVALALLCTFFDDGGDILTMSGSNGNIDKLFIRRRLGWIYTSMPDVNPSRATLQSVNSYLMERRG